MIAAMPKKKIESEEQTTKSLLHLDIVQKGLYAQIHQGKEIIYVILSPVVWNIKVIRYRSSGSKIETSPIPKYILYYIDSA